MVTRAAEQSGELARMLEERGAEVLLLPLVRFAPMQRGAMLDIELQLLGTFDAILFLSANAVRYVFERCRDLEIPPEAVNGLRVIAAVGPATARALSENGVRVDYVAREHTGEGLARELKGSLAGRSVLVPRSDQGKEEAVSLALREIGATAREVVAYRTVMPESMDGAIADRIRRAEVDVAIFASPSAVQNFAAVLGAEDAAKIAQRIQFAAIGPTTAKALRDTGLRVAIEAVESSAEGIADAIEAFYERQAETVRRAQ